jgi:glutamate synthase (NADPH/NADH) small chain
MRAGIIVKSNNLRVKINEQDPLDRVKNFDEVVLGYNIKEATIEANRCLNCKDAPCIKDCPVNINIPKFIKEIANDDLASAYNTILENNSFPGVCGRVCPQERQCQMNCVRGLKGESIAIGDLERFVGDNVSSENTGTTFLKNKVAIVGSGPASLACAGYLLENGIGVTLYEALHSLGGVMRYGIPEFRLPKSVLDKEINNLVNKGLEVEKNIIVGSTIDIDELFDSGVDAIFLGLGAGSPRMLNILGENGNGVYSANEFLTRVNLMEAYKKESDTPIYVGNNVLIIGGGNVALDAARVAKRLTEGQVKIIYRRGLEDMPARKIEIEHAKEEGIKIMTQLTPTEIVLENGWVTGLKCNEMMLTDKVDSSNRHVYVQNKSKEVSLNADTIIVAIGQIPNPTIKKISEELKLNNKNIVVVNENLETSLENVYAGGDITTGSSTVINAISAGIKAAKNIIRNIRGERNE